MHISEIEIDGQVFCKKTGKVETVEIVIQGEVTGNVIVKLGGGTGWYELGDLDPVGSHRDHDFAIGEEVICIDPLDAACPKLGQICIIEKLFDHSFGKNVKVKGYGVELQLFRFAKCVGENKPPFHLGQNVRAREVMQGSFMVAEIRKTPAGWGIRLEGSDTPYPAEAFVDDATPPPIIPFYVGQNVKPADDNGPLPEELIGVESASITSIKQSDQIEGAFMVEITGVRGVEFNSVWFKPDIDAEVVLSNATELEQIELTEDVTCGQCNGSGLASEAALSMQEIADIRGWLVESPMIGEDLQKLQDLYQKVTERIERLSQQFAANPQSLTEIESRLKYEHSSPAVDFPSPQESDQDKTTGYRRYAEMTYGQTPDEKKVMELLSEATEIFMTCKCVTQTQVDDFIFGVHRCQDQIALQVARRVEPTEWR